MIPLRTISLAWTFGLLTTTILIAASLVYLLTFSVSCSRIQGPRKSTPNFAAESLGTVQCLFIVSSMAAWPIGKARLGMETGFVWTLEEMGLSLELTCAQMFFGVLFMDAVTYWKHRLLHTKLFYPFHRTHHQFHDPTPLGGFALGSVEAVLTFWPIWGLCSPICKMFAPIYILLVTGFVFLNFYLHCGVTVDRFEASLSAIGLNSSAWHNVHHSHVRTNYGEISYVWDVICQTGRTPSDARRRIPREVKKVNARRMHVT